MVTLQPHADDSGSDPQSHTFVFGGLVATPARWMDFAVEWQSALDRGPIKLDYFKMTEAMSRTEQFALTRGWDRDLRDEKLSQLVDIILRYSRSAAFVSMRQADFKTYVRSIPLPERNTVTDTPYLMLITQFVLLMCDDANRHGETCTFDFVFDRQMGIEEPLQDWWPHIKDIARNNGGDRFLGQMPIFRDEKAVLPLQAADLFAWEQRKHLENNKFLIVRPSLALRRLRQIRTISTEFTRENLTYVQGEVLKMADQMAADNPGMKWRLAGKQERNATKKAAKKGKPKSPSGEIRS